MLSASFENATNWTTYIGVHTLCGKAESNYTHTNVFCPNWNDGKFSIRIIEILMEFLLSFYFIRNLIDSNRIYRLNRSIGTITHIFHKYTFQTRTILTICMEHTHTRTHTRPLSFFGSKTHKLFFFGWIELLAVSRKLKKSRIWCETNRSINFN